MKDITIVIPVFNEEKYIGRLLDSIEKVDYPKEHYEVIVVSDGSTDNTANVVKNFSRVRLIELPKNHGRYKTRKKGTEAANFPYILFVDSRTIVEPDILTILSTVDAKAVVGRVLNTKKLTYFEIFYQAIRRIVFAKYFNECASESLYIERYNFDSTPKGTGVFFCEKQILFAAYNELSTENMDQNASDDTKLLWTIVKQVPILRHPGVKITYYARPSFNASIDHLFNRGTYFVDYYFNPSKNNFWLVIILPLLSFISLLFGFIFFPVSSLIKISVILGLDILGAILLSQSFSEFYVILFMMPICVITFYAGILRGLYFKYFHSMKD